MEHGSRLHNFAAIDVGSHTIRLLLARVEGQEVQPLRSERRITRLARGFQTESLLQPASVSESLRVLEGYAGRLAGQGAVACGCTGVIRRARNSEDFLRRIRKRTGIEAQIISEQREAFLSAKGVLSALANPKGLILTFDLGGSSTELLLVDTRRPDPLWSTSVFIGAATVSEAFLTADPPGAGAVERASQAVRDQLDPVLAELAPLLQSARAAFSLVGTAGTITTLAAMHLGMTRYEPYRVNGLRLAEAWIEAMVERLAAMPLAARREIPGLEPGREDIILGGALIVRELLRGLGQTNVAVTDAGLLEGLLLEAIERQMGLAASLATPLRWRFAPREAGQPGRPLDCANHRLLSDSL